MPPCVTRPAYMALISNGVVACICKYCHTYFLNLLRVFLKVVTSIFVNLVELVASACAGPAVSDLTLHMCLNNPVQFRQELT